MTPETLAEPTDDPAFLACADRFIASLVERHAPDEVYLVRIAGCFDHKWLRFSGIGRVAFHGSSVIDTALGVFRQELVNFPPFTPNRVIVQHSFARTTAGEFEEQAPARLIHGKGHRRSAQNLHRRVADFSRSAIFVWFSSDSAAVGRGSVMAYTVAANELGTWYAALRNDCGWKLEHVKGANRATIASLLDGPGQTIGT